ncbi:uncharacterized [Tachysurus ichikawai]
MARSRVRYRHDEPEALMPEEHHDGIARLMWWRGCEEKEEEEEEEDEEAQVQQASMKELDWKSGEDPDSGRQPGEAAVDHRCRRRHLVHLPRVSVSVLCWKV